MQKHTRVFILLIVVIAFVLRFYKLGLIPPSLNWDETAHGYNAFSILKTGRDEYGYFLPLSFRSFDDYKPPLYTYLVVPSVAVFGLNNFAVRFPSASLGVLAVLFTYLLVFELFKNRGLAILSAFFLAISPWHLQFSRVAFETNSAIFWSVLATWAFLKGVRLKGKRLAFWMSLSAIAFGANLFMYHNARVFVPIFSAALLILFRRKLVSQLKYLIVPAVIVIVFISFLLPILFSISGQLRYKGTTIFAIEIPKIEAADKIAIDHQAGQGLLGQILHNRRAAYIPTLVQNYLVHLRPEYLFFKADMERHHAPLVGLLYLWDLPFIIAGLYFLARKSYQLETKIILFWWFLIAPVASSVTWGVPHSLRSEIYLPTFQIFTALGLYHLYAIFKMKRLFAGVAASLLLFNFLFYLHQYYYHLPVRYSQSWLYGRKEAVLATEELKGGYDRVIVSTKLEQPYMFWLYYSKYDPAKYISEGGTKSGGFLEEGNRYGKYLFKQVDYQKQREENPRTLFVGKPEEFPDNVKPLKEIRYLNGEKAIFISD